MMIKNYFLRNKHLFAVGSWFFGDFVIRYKYKIALITFFGAAATAIQAGMLAFFSRYLTNGLNFNHAELFTHQYANVAFGLLIFLVLASSAVLMYLNGRQTLQLWPIYQIHVVNRMLGALHDAAKRGVVDTDTIKQTIIPKVLISSQRMGAFTRLVTKSILPIIQFIGFTIVAFSINPVISLVVFLIITPISAVALLFFSRKASQCDRAAESMARDSSKQMLEIIETNTQAKQKLVTLNNNKSESIIEKRIDFFVKRLEWSERARLTVGLITVGLLAGIFIYSSTATSAGLAELIVYLVSLMLSFRQLASLALTVSNFGRFYPTVSRYMHLLNIVSTSATADEFKLRIQKARLRSAGTSELEEDLI